MEESFEFDERNNKGTFNEAFLQMRRISELQATINNLRAIPLKYNNELDSYNYQIIFSNLCSLLLEAWGKMSKTEREESDTLRKLIQRFIRTAPPHVYTKDLTTNAGKISIDNDKWFKLEDALIEFEKSIKIYMDKHGLSNPTDEGSGLFD